jgi:hypothetical protein
MQDLPPPDLRDQSGRLRRLFLALLVGAVLASVAYGLLWSVTDPSEYGAYRFVYAFTALAFGGGFAIVLAILDRRAKHKAMAELVARAQVHR